MPSPLKHAPPQPFVIKAPRFFNSPDASGRQIICSFCYIQRLGKRGVIDTWFPDDLHQKIAERIAANDHTVLHELGVEWAAIREFSLIQEAEFEEDFDPERIKKAMRDSIKWRGQDGYRVTVVMLGNYTRLGEYDELRIHDERLQEEITKLIHMLYLDKESEKISERCTSELKRNGWNLSETLPHVIMTLGSMAATGRGAARSKKCAGVVAKIIELVEHLPRESVVHDVAVGLAMPDHDEKFRREKNVEGWEKFSAFKQLLANVFEPLGHKSMGGLHGTGEKSEHIYNTNNMRGFRNLRASMDINNLEAAQTFVL